MPVIQNFPGGGMPPDPPSSALCATPLPPFHRVNWPDQQKIASAGPEIPLAQDLEVTSGSQLFGGAMKNHTSSLAVSQVHMVIALKLRAYVKLTCVSACGVPLQLERLLLTLLSQIHQSTSFSIRSY